MLIACGDADRISGEFPQEIIIKYKYHNCHIHRRRREGTVYSFIILARFSGDYRIVSQANEEIPFQIRPEVRKKSSVIGRISNLKTRCASYRRGCHR